MAMTAISLIPVVRPTPLARLGKFDCIPADTAECVDNDVAATAFGDVGGYGLWGDGEPSGRVEKERKVVVEGKEEVSLMPVCMLGAAVTKGLHLTSSLGTWSALMNRCTSPVQSHGWPSWSSRALPFREATLRFFAGGLYVSLALEGPASGTSIDCSCVDSSAVVARSSGCVDKNRPPTSAKMASDLA